MTEAAGQNANGRVATAFIQYEPALVRYALKLTGDAETAREVVQDTFVRFCQNAANPGCAKTPPNPTSALAATTETNGHAAWLFAVCRNRAIDVLKRRRTIRLSAEDVAAHAGGQSPPPNAAIERAEEHAEVMGWLAGLPPRQREVVRLKFHAGLSYHDIGELLGLSATNVGFLIHTALKALRANAKRE